MRIEINATGIGSVSSLQNGLSKLHTDICVTIESLRDTKRRIDNITGGVGNLSDAAASLQNRIRTEENKLSAVERLKQKTNRFIDNTVSTDSQVAHLITVNQEKFFETWSRSPMSGEKSWWERFVDGWNDFWDDVGEVLDNVLTGIVEFIKEHAVEIIVGAVAILVGALITAITGGVAAAFIPALLAGLKAAAISALVGGIISGVIALFTGDNPLEAFGDGFASGFMWGGISFGIKSAIDPLRKMFSSLKKTKIRGRKDLYYKQEGGAYSDMVKLSNGKHPPKGLPQEECHHMPPKYVYGNDRNMMRKGPAIIMDKLDHQMTNGFDSHGSAGIYRAEQKKLVDSGKFLEALENDIADIQSKFGHKYDGAIEKVRQYVDQLIKEGIIK